MDDHLGSTSVMIDEAGELIERTLYYPFGSHREGGEEKYTFTGKELDSEIGLYYYGARYYNSETFVFTQADTVIPNVYNPQALNRYSYCYNNPLKYEDPDGHEATIALIILGGTAIGAIIGAAIGIEKGLDDAWVRYYEAKDETPKLYMEMLKDIGKPTIGYAVEGAGAGLSITAGVVAAVGGGVVGGSVGATAAAVAIGGGTSALTGGFSELVWAVLEGKGLDETINAIKEGVENGGAIGVASGLVPGAGEAMSTTFEKDRGYGSDGKGHAYNSENIFEISQNSLRVTSPTYTQAELRKMGIIKHKE